MEIAYFPTLYETSASKVIDINQLFTLIREGIDEEHRQNCLKAKTATNKEELNKIKRRLPCVMISGTCSSRNLQGFKQHSNLIQLDFDHVSDVHHKFHQIKEDKYSFLSFVSPSGKGLKVINIIDGNKHTESFEFLANYYHEMYQIKADQSCKDKTRLMFIPYDTNIYRNDSAIQSKVIKRETQKTPLQYRSSPRSVGDITIETLIHKIESSKKDITSERSDWIKIAFALANELNESGREYFHRISQFYENYSPAEVDKTYSYCLRANKGKINLGTIYHIAKQHQVMLF
ncbi:BT4734/BF3469 family protein [Flammeovirga sp. OC4]|uniref:BT4734/BF3469 family protein n=1 Tax=Flammeovirga sp. OC4 TaxID=1382345 RepID=UPI000693E435|nr:BT4734/BF3469 family protein [Flammeovirga sp. OC4]